MGFGSGSLPYGVVRASPATSASGTCASSTIERQPANSIARPRLDAISAVSTPPTGEVNINTRPAPVLAIDRHRAPRRRYSSRSRTEVAALDVTHPSTGTPAVTAAPWAVRTTGSINDRIHTATAP